MAAPKRPATVPKNAVWVEDDREWESGAKSKSGKKNGAYKYFRADGTLCNECSFVDGVPEGAFKRFHENGEVSQEGAFVKGQLHGTRRWFATDGKTTEKMHESGVSEVIRKSEMDYDMGRVVAVRHFDKSGQRVQPDGTAIPTVPPGVPPNGTEFRGDLNQWVEPKLDDDGERHGSWRAWTIDGDPAEDIEYDHGARHGRAIELGQGSLYEVGYFDHDFAIEQWSLIADGGKKIWSGDLGVKLDSAFLVASPVFEDARKPAAHWQALADQAIAARRFGEAALALARLTATTHSVTKLDALLREHSVPRPPDFSEQMAEQLAPTQGLTMGPAVNALMRGAAPARVLQGIAIALDQAFYSRAALDFVNAAILLAPDRLGLLFTRGLVLMSLGLDEQARSDANQLAAAEPDQAEFLLHYLDALFPAFDFWPAKEKPTTTYDALPDKPDRTLAEVKAMAQKLAHRLGLVRQELLTRIKPEVKWMPPELSALLKGAKVTLERDAFTLAGDDGEQTEVTLDETLDMNGWDIPRLMAMARDEWACLTWLCWACGQSKVSLPIKVSAPKDFGAAAGMAQQRLWRSRDLRVMGPREVDSPSFVWEGMSIEEVPQPLAHLPEGQYADVQALFLWLSSKDVRSPWQDNLRGS